MRVTDKDIKKNYYRRRPGARRADVFIGGPVRGQGIWLPGQPYGSGVILPGELIFGSGYGRRSIAMSMGQIQGRGVFDFLRRGFQKTLAIVKKEGPQIIRSSLLDGVEQVSQGKSLKEAAFHAGKSTLQAAREVGQKQAEQDAKALVNQLKDMAISQVAERAGLTPKGGRTSLIPNVDNTISDGQLKLIKSMSKKDPYAAAPGLGTNTKYTLQQLVLMKHGKASKPVKKAKKGPKRMPKARAAGKRGGGITYL